MKKPLSFIALLVIFLMSNCSEIPENNDPILGIWARLEIVSENDNNEDEIREEWIFNDAFLGRYQSYTNDELVSISDFSWSNEDGIYTIIYRDATIPGVEVRLEQAFSPEILALQNGLTFAERE